MRNTLASTLAPPKLTAADAVRHRLGVAAADLALPVLAFAVFLALWAVLASSVETSIGRLPGPLAVVHAAGDLIHQHGEERRKAAEYDLRQRDLAAAAAAAGRPFTVRRYAGPPTYLDQIVTSLETVFAGFFLASLVAVPLGIVCGSSPRAYAALNPLIQIFKPVSPLAWLPIVMILVSALYTSPDPWFEKSFVSSAITVALCSLWPTLVNTALGVSSIDHDYLNVARVLRLGWWDRTVHIVLPSALPLIFTGLRLSLGVGWMVLIAAEMLAQNPGPRKIRVGHVPERQQPDARADHGRRVHHRHHRLHARPHDARSAASRELRLVSTPLLELYRVAKGFGTGRERREVLADIDLAIREGEFLAVIGFSGSGKTTLINLLAGLLPPDSGSVSFRGEAVTAPGPERAVVFQTYGLLPWLTVRGNIALAMRAAGTLAAADQAAEVERIVALVGLTAAIDRRPRQLSGGMRQRVALARALAMRPQVLLMDEPLGALDALTRAKLQGELVRLWQHERHTVVMVTNDVDEALLLADRIIPLDPGPRARLGPPFLVDLPRPRDATSLNRDATFRRLRNQVTEYLLDVGHVAGHAPAAPEPLPDLAPDHEWRSALTPWRAAIAGRIGS